MWKVSRNEGVLVFSLKESQLFKAFIPEERIHIAGRMLLGNYNLGFGWREMRRRWAIQLVPMLFANKFNRLFVQFNILPFQG
jgi:hypothetical protein